MNLEQRAELEMAEKGEKKEEAPVEAPQDAEAPVKEAPEAPEVAPEEKK